MSTFDTSWHKSLLGKNPVETKPKADQPAIPRHKKPACDEQEFLRCVEKHQIKILRDDGVYRHLRFAAPSNCNQWFELITYPGNLVFGGDMGTYVFNRVEDMFTFFRRNSLTIDPSYWGQKLTAIDRCDGFEKWNAEKFKDEINEWLNEANASRKLRQAVEDEIISQVDEGQHAAMQAVYDFEHDGFTFQDFSEVRCEEYTYRFLWCCYAIVWGIQKYDAKKGAE